MVLVSLHLVSPVLALISLDGKGFGYGRRAVGNTQ
jgi:hypothetical protein